MSPPPPPLGATPEPSEPTQADKLALIIFAKPNLTLGEIQDLCEAHVAEVTATARAALAQCEERLDGMTRSRDNWAKLHRVESGHHAEFARQAESAESALSLLTAKLAQEGEDRKRLDWLEKTLIHSKWDDAIPAIRPRHPTEFYPIAKYIGEDQWNIREAIDAAISAATPATTGKDVPSL